MNGSEKSFKSVNEVIAEVFTDPDWPFKIGIGCLINGAAFGLAMINIIALPLCFCLASLTSGYILMTAYAKVLDPYAKLPDWKNHLELLIGGGMWIAVYVLYFIVVMLVALACFVFGQVTGSGNILHAAFVPWAIITWSLMITLTTLVSFICPYLMVNFAVRQNIVCAFAVGEVWRRFKNQPKRLLAAWLIQMGLIYLSVLIPMITVIGILVIPSTCFCAQLIGSCILAQAWRETEPNKKIGNV